MDATGKHRLVAHPAFPPLRVRGVEVDAAVKGTGIALTYAVEGDDLCVPPLASARRRDELWRTTCFELFVGQGEEHAYSEFNFSPSSEWAAYAFSGYRLGLAELHLPRPPRIERLTARLRWEVELSLDAPLAPGARLGLCAVVEESDGTKSYWALAHPNSDKPDFHDPACFTLELPPPPLP